MKKAYNAIMGHINVTPEMRQRVLGRIAQEDIAPAQSKVLRFPALRKYLSIAACLILLIAGAAVLPHLLERIGPEPPPTLAVPGITEAQSLQELSALVGFEVAEEFSLPFEAEETAYFSYSSELAEVVYSGGGQSAVFRQSLGTKDNSGDYNTYSEQTGITANGWKAVLKGNGGGYVLAVWTDGTYAYSLSIPSGAPEEVWHTILCSFSP